MFGWLLSLQLFKEKKKKRIRQAGKTLVNFNNVITPILSSHLLSQSSLSQSAFTLWFKSVLSVILSLIHATHFLPISTSPKSELYPSLALHHHQRLDSRGSVLNLITAGILCLHGLLESKIQVYQNFSVSINHIHFFQMILLMRDHH